MVEALRESIFWTPLLIIMFGLFASIFAFVFAMIFSLFIKDNQYIKPFIFASFTLGIVGYVVFFVSFFSPIIGQLVSIGFLLLLITKYKKSSSSTKNMALQIFWFIFLLEMVIISLAANGDSALSLELFSSRWTNPPLPVDNVLPMIFADQIRSGQVSKPMFGDWLSSDRPPLQAGVYLLYSFLIHSPFTTRLLWECKF